MYEDIKEMAAEAKDELWELAEGEPKFYLHWTAGWYGNPSDHYHICIDEGGGYELMTDDLAEVKSHTWNRNSGAIGIALEAFVGAKVVETEDGYNVDLGENPPTDKQIKAMCEICAAICEELNISADSIMTHAEAADKDGYGLDDDDPDCRWDLAVLHETDDWGTGGDMIRDIVGRMLQREE